MLEKTLLNIIEHQERSAQRVDQINKRLINAIILGIIVAGIVAISVCLMYFGIDYSYPEFNQSQEQSFAEGHQLQHQGGE